MDPTYPLFPIFAFVAFVVVLVPLPWHWRSWNAGTCSFMVWVAIANLLWFVNSVVWHGNVNNPAPVWCDITTKLLVGAGVGIPASCLCINRRLYKIASGSVMGMTRNDRRRAIYLDLLITAGLPILVMILHVVVQGHRFDIVEDIGCSAVVYMTALAFPLYLLWPPVLGAVSFIYAGLALRAFMRQRAQFEHVLASKANECSSSRYFRLMTLSIVDMSFSVPISIYQLYTSNAGIPLQPWISWADTHFDFGRVQLVPALVWQSDPLSAQAIQLSRWPTPFCALIFFALFGFSQEAIKAYKSALSPVARRFGCFSRVRNDNSLAKSLPSNSSCEKFELSSEKGSTLPPSLPPVYTKYTLDSKHDSFLTSVLSPSTTGTPSTADSPPPGFDAAYPFDRSSLSTLTEVTTPTSSVKASGEWEIIDVYYAGDESLTHSSETSDSVLPPVRPFHLPTSLQRNYRPGSPTEPVAKYPSDVTHMA